MARNLLAASSQYLECASAVVAGVPFSMGCWFYPTTTGSRYWLMALGDPTTSGTGFLLRQQLTTAEIQCFANTSAATTTTTHTANAWNHALAVFAANNDRRVYLNGGGKGTNSVSQSIGTLTKTRLGNRCHTGVNGGMLNGRICEAAVWNAALTDEEAAALGAGASPLEIRPGALAAYWPLRLAEDLDGLGNFPLTPQASPTTAEHKSLLRRRRLWLPPSRSAIFRRNRFQLGTQIGKRQVA